MNQIDKVVIGQNVKRMREAAGLSQHDFSFLLDISKRSLASVESGSANISLDLINKISAFFNLELSFLANKRLTITDNFRDDLVSFHKGNKALQNILLKRPNLTYAITYKLLKTDFLNQPREVNDIKLFFEEIGWKYLGTSISNALKREDDNILIKVHPTKKGTFVYSKK